MKLLVHSCDGREWIREHWEEFFNRSKWDADVVYIDGDEYFSDQLIRVLSELEDEYVWHILDDYFIKQNIDWDYYWEMAQVLRVDALRMQPGVGFDSLPYRFRREGFLFRQTNESEYQITMTSSIWRREFFLSCLSSGLNPWEQEVSKKINGWPHEIYFVPDLPEWYVNGTLKGILTPAGRALINEITGT